MPISGIRDVLDVIRNVCTVTPVDIETHDLGLDLIEQHQFADAMIVAAVMRAGCTVLFTEDLQHGQNIGGVTISNAFVA